MNRGEQLSNAKRATMLAIMCLTTMMLLARLAKAQQATYTIGTQPTQQQSYSQQPDADQSAKEPPIDPFTCELKAYDASLEPKYIEETHASNQAKLLREVATYKKQAQTALESQKKLCVPINDSYCIRQAELRFNAKIRNVSATYDQLRLTDDENYRVALANSQSRMESEEKAKKQEQEEREKSFQARAESIKEQQDQFTRDKLAYERKQLADASHASSSSDILNEVNSIVAESSGRNKQGVLPPEEFDAPRVAYTPIRRSRYSDNVSKEHNASEILGLTKSNHQSKTRPTLEALTKTRDSLIESYVRLQREYESVNDGSRNTSEQLRAMRQSILELSEKMSNAHNVADTLTPSRQGHRQAKQVSTSNK